MSYKSPRSSTFAFLLMILCLAMPVVPGWADEDATDYLVAFKPGFKIVDQQYGKFETPEYTLQPALNNLQISADLDTSASGRIRSYVRLKFATTGRWSDFKEFEGEFHFAALEAVNAYQLMFIMIDAAKGSNAVQRISVQGRNVDEKLMAWLLQEPAPFEPGKVYPKPDVLSRSAWGARPPKGSYSQHRVQRIILHHSWIPSAAQYTGAGTIRGIQNYHMDSSATGWNDIGYHFLIGPDGKIYQGRPETVVGAHCSPNTNSVGICMIGDYDEGKDEINPAMEESMLKLVSWLASNYKVDPKVNLYGHCDFSEKSCPGTAAYKRLPKYREIVQANISAQ